MGMTEKSLRSALRVGQIGIACRDVGSGLSQGEGRLTITPPSPLFFVSVESKRLRFSVSSLFSALTREFTSVESKGLTGAGCLQESNWVGPDDFGGVRRTARREAIEWHGTRESCLGNTPIIPYRYPLSSDYCKWLVCWEIVGEPCRRRRGKVKIPALKNRGQGTQNRLRVLRPGHPSKITGEIQEPHPLKNQTPKGAPPRIVLASYVCATRPSGRRLPPTKERVEFDAEQPDDSIDR